jgi:FkbM family methyltransferase
MAQPKSPALKLDALRQRANEVLTNRVDACEAPADAELSDHARHTPTSDDLAPEQWLDKILASYLSLAHNYEDNNFDHRRFPHADSESVFQIDDHLQYLKFFFSNFRRLVATRNRLADEYSKNLFDQLIEYRLLGHIHVRLPTNTSDHWDTRQVAQRLKVAESGNRGMLGPLSVFALEFLGHPLRLEVWGVAWTFFFKQYFFERDGMRICPQPGDHVIDAGACLGDTALAFAAAVGSGGRIYSFEMMPKHLAIIRNNLNMNPALAGRIELFSCGLSRDSNEIEESQIEESQPGGGIDPGARLSLDAFPVRSIDLLVAEQRIERVDFIKMDIEGSELDALQGAENAIRTFKPNLAISLYHRFDDFWTIPAYICGLGLGYRLYLEHYTIYAEETVLYATVGEGR